MLSKNKMSKYLHGSMKVTIRIDFAQKIKRYEHIYALMTAFEENKKPPKKRRRKKKRK